MGVEILTQSEVTLTFEEGSSSRQLQIGVRDNSVYDGGEDRIFAIILSLLYTDFENLNISSDYVEVRITDDEPQPEGICNRIPHYTVKFLRGKFLENFALFVKVFSTKYLGRAIYRGLVFDSEVSWYMVALECRGEGKRYVVRFIRLSKKVVFFLMQE